MSRTMICTRCFRDTGTDPDFGDMAKKKGGAYAIISLCENWMCNDCLDQAKYEQEQHNRPSEGRVERK